MTHYKSRYIALIDSFYKNFILFYSYISVGGQRDNIYWKFNPPGVFPVVSSPAVVGPGDYAGHQVQLPDHPVEPSLSHLAASIHILHILQTSQLLQE